MDNLESVYLSTARVCNNCDCVVRDVKVKGAKIVIELPGNHSISERWSEYKVHNCEEDNNG